MKMEFVSTPISGLETECLVVTAVAAAEKSENGTGKKPAPRLITDDPAVNAAASELIASGEVTAEAMELTLLHKPAGLAAKRLLVVGGGKAKTFGPSDV